MNVRRPILALVCLALACTAAAAARTPAGHWEGSVDIPGQTLAFDVDLTVEGGTWSGDITIPAQGARDLPLERIALNGNEVTFTIKGIPGGPVFTGTMLEDGRKVAGSFTQGGTTVGFSMTRSPGASAAAPSAAKSPPAASAAAPASPGSPPAASETAPVAPKRPPASAEGPAGHWKGTIDIPGQPLAFDVDLAVEGGTWSGDITIPAQGARDLPLESVAVKGNEVSFAIRGIPGAPTFTGTLQGDGQQIAGTFTQGGQTLSFSMSRAPSASAAAQGALEDLRPIVEAALADWKTPGLAIAVVADGTVVLAEGYGLRDVERKLPVTPRTLFAIGSSTKAFTTFVLATLVDEGRLRWDDPVADHLPGFRLHDEHATAHLTARDLVTHRSGLPRHDLVWYGDESTTRADLVRRLRFLPPNKDLRETWQYNNLMYLTAGHLEEVLTGGSWEDAVRARILEPLGMRRTNFTVADSQKDEDAARPYLEKDDRVRAVPFRPIGIMGPAGSINSCAEDMARWLQLHLGTGEVEGRRIVETATLREMHTPQMAIAGLPEETWLSPASYGLGWFVDTWRGHYRVHHGGNIDGFSALVTLFPREGVGVAVLVNKNGSALPDLVTSVVADRLLALEPRDWIGEAAAKRDLAKAFTKDAEKNKARFRVAGTSPSHALPDYAGEYQHDGYGTLEVVRSGAGLALRYHGMTMPLEHWHYDVFNVAEVEDEIVPEDLRVRFVVDDRGRIAGLTAAVEPFVEPIVFGRAAERKLRDPSYLTRLAGDYQVPNLTLTFSLRGDRLVLQVPGQPTYALEPTGSDEFRLVDVEGFGVRFTVPASGEATEALLIQPDGVYTATRVVGGTSR